jgi:hypothetical protein
MDEFTCRVEDLNSKFTLIKSSPSQQNLALPSETRNGSAPTNLFVSQLGNGTLIPHSSSSNQLSKDSPLTEEVFLLMLPHAFLSALTPVLPLVLLKLCCADGTSKLDDAI